MQLTKTEYSAELLEKWKTDVCSSGEITNILQTFLTMFNSVFGNTTRAKNFGVYIKGRNKL